MTISLYCIALVIVFHNLLLIYGALHVLREKKAIVTVLTELTMIGIVILAILLQRWEILAIGFAIHRSWIAIDSFIQSTRHNKNPSLLLPVNLLAIAGALVAYITHIWLIFILTYGLFWLLTLFVGRKIMSRNYTSQKLL